MLTTQRTRVTQTKQSLTRLCAVTLPVTCYNCVILYPARLGVASPSCPRMRPASRVRWTPSTTTAYLTFLGSSPGQHIHQQAGLTSVLCSRQNSCQRPPIPLNLGEQSGRSIEGIHACIAHISSTPAAQRQHDRGSCALHQAASSSPSVEVPRMPTPRAEMPPTRATLIQHTTMATAIITAAAASIPASAHLVGADPRVEGVGAATLARLSRTR